MKRLSLIGYFGILLASLVLAYLTWVQEPKKPGGGVSIFPCEKGDILKITYETKTQTVTFSRRKSRYSGEFSWWVETVEHREAADAGEAGGAEGAGRREAAPEGPDAPEEASPDADRPEVEIFKANRERLQERLDAFCPWRALRSLGKPGEDRLSQFGLTDSEESLLIERVRGPKRFRLGEVTFGPKDRYVADAETGEVFLVAGEDLRDLGRPKSRFMERSLHAFRMKEVSRVRLRAGQREKELVQGFSEEGGEEGWADSRSPEEMQVLYRNWIRRVTTLRPIEYLGTSVEETAGECSAPEGATRELSLTFYAPDREIGFLNLYRGNETGEPAYYACSEHSERVVEVPKTQAEAILKDLEDVLSD